MKKAILLLVVLALVGGVAFAADLTGKVEFGQTLDLNEADNDKVVTNEPIFEINVNAAVDDFNSATIEIRENVPSGDLTVTNAGADVGTVNIGNVATIGSFFFTSDIGGALGLTDLTGGLTLKYKGGWFGVEAPEIGEIKDLTNFSDVLNEHGQLKSSGTDLSSVLTVGWGGFVNLDVGTNLDFRNATKMGDDDNDDLEILLAVYGNIAAGPGTFGYLVAYNDKSDVKGLDKGIIGAGLEYKDIAVGGDITLGFGAEGYFNLDADEKKNFGYGVDIAADISNWLDLNLDVAGDAGSVLDNIGLGIGVQTPSESLGLGLDVKLMDILDDTTTENVTEELALGLTPDIWVKSGAATFTVGWEAANLLKLDEANNKLKFTAALGF